MIEAVGKIESNLKKLVKKGTFNTEMATGNFNKVLDVILITGNYKATSTCRFGTVSGDINQEIVGH